ncbi:MAG: hypothetical protein IKJ11_07530 [Clostridia bacterium]|nr:hypothetical protein [Clostridia bacterium]
MIIGKKSVIMLLCALMVISSAAFGTVAYLTDRAGLTNRFTVGNVDIAVDETMVDKDGNPVSNPDYDPDDPDEADRPNLRTESMNEYPLVPGGEYTKDPTMTIRAGSAESYVRMMVTISNASQIEAIFADLKDKHPQDYADGFVPGAFVTERNNAVWIRTGTMTRDETLNTYTLEFRYFKPVKPGDAEDLVLEPLFETIRFPGDLTNAHLSQLTDFFIDIDGHAIQTIGFDNADEAWTAFDAQLTADATTNDGAGDTGSVKP